VEPSGDEDAFGRNTSVADEKWLLLLSCEAKYNKANSDMYSCSCEDSPHAPLCKTMKRSNPKLVLTVMKRKGTVRDTV
jgi:hypothetical protein